MTQEKQYPGYISCDRAELSDVLSQLITSQFLPERLAPFEQALRTMATWSWESNPGVDIQRIWLSDEVVRRITNEVDISYRGFVLTLFAPPEGGKTLDHFMGHALALVKKWTEYLAQKSAYIFNRYSRDDKRYLGSGHPKTVSSRSSYVHWAAKLIVDEHIPKGTVNDYSLRQELEKTLSMDFRPWGQSSEWRKEFNLLNEWLFGRASSLNLSFLEFAQEVKLGRNFGAEWDLLRERIDNCIFIDYGGTQSAHVKQSGLLESLLRSFNINSGLLSYHSKPKKHRELILSQNRATLRQAIEDVNNFPGGGYEVLVDFLATCRQKVGLEIGSLRPRSGLDIALSMQRLLFASGARLGNDEHPDRIKALNIAALSNFPKVSQFQNLALIWTRIITKFEAKGVIEVIKFEEFAAFLIGLSYPTSWIRGSHQEAPYLLMEMMEKGGVLATLTILADIIIREEGSIPTGAEWKNAIGQVDFAIGAPMALPLIVKNYSDELRPIPKDLKELRWTLKKR